LCPLPLVLSLGTTEKMNSQEFCNPHNLQTDQMLINHPMPKSAHFPSGLEVISLPFLPS